MPMVAKLLKERYFVCDMLWSKVCKEKVQLHAFHPCLFIEASLRTEIELLHLPPPQKQMFASLQPVSSEIGKYVFAGPRLRAQTNTHRTGIKLLV